MSWDEHRDEKRDRRMPSIAGENDGAQVDHRGLRQKIPDPTGRPKCEDMADAYKLGLRAIRARRRLGVVEREL
ncbi:MAG: hypothetical protein MRY63_11265 [Neomegalonema sp.]|nr:hypothetical protein [Neomegalonema sp.]